MAVRPFFGVGQTSTSSVAISESDPKATSAVDQVARCRCRAAAFLTPRSQETGGASTEGKSAVLLLHSNVQRALARVSRYSWRITLPK
jgi:hypothetical protein